MNLIAKTAGRLLRWYMRSLFTLKQGRTPTSKTGAAAVLFRLRVKGPCRVHRGAQVRPSNRADKVIHPEAYVRSWWLVQNGAKWRGLIEERISVLRLSQPSSQDRCRRCDMLVAIAMSLSFSWTGVARCRPKPQLHASDVPPGT